MLYDFTNKISLNTGTKQIKFIVKFGMCYIKYAYN